ncbi:MAG: DUF4258 domain-containing protein [Candidatus Cloacimonetes bacterium]|nr:DUF4258 domain-containing protein [Candidatus Cloacimonadota bacterium]
MHFKFSKHALMQMERRGIKKELVEKIIHNPDKIIKQDKELRIYSKLVNELVNESSKDYLYRVFMNDLKEPKLVVTVYETIYKKE